MWNNYWGGRARRDIPQVNYRETSSEEDDFDSPLQSPTRPVNTREGSPAELAVPQLNDNVDEELESVRTTLQNVGHTHTFRNTIPGGAGVRGVVVPDGGDIVGEEVVDEGLVAEEADLKVGAGADEDEIED